MRKLLLAVAVLVPAYALAFELPKSAPKMPDSINKASKDVKDGANSAAKDAGKQAKDTAKDSAKDAVKPLNHADQISLCAAELPKQLECKEDFCTAMVELRTAQDPKFKDIKGDADKLKAMHAKCLEEIAVDGAGDEPARKTRCEGWHKERGDMAINKTVADNMTACWTKSTCGERVSCWKPQMATVMSATMAQKKAPPVK